MFRNTNIKWLLVAAGLISSAALAHRTTPPPSNTLKGQYITQHIESMINPNRNRSMGRRFTWLNNRLSITGLINVDGVYFARGWNRLSAATPAVVPSFFVGIPHSNDVSVNNMNLLLDVHVNRFTQAHGSIVFRDVPGPGPFEFNSDNINDVIGLGCKNNPQFTMDEAYITLGYLNNPRSRYYLPFYFRVGREYIPFGHYRDPYPLTKSFTQLMSQTNANVAQIGFIGRINRGSKLYGSLFAFNGPYSGPLDESASFVTASRIRNWGGKIGYRARYRQLTYELSASVLRDFRDTDYFVDNFECGNAPFGPPISRRVEAISLYGAFNRGPVDFMANYITTVRDIFPGLDDSRPSTYTLLGGYRFFTYGRSSKLSLSYQRSADTYDSTTSLPVAFSPKYRVQATYKVVLGRYTALILQFNHNHNYEALHNLVIAPGISSYSNVAKARLTVHF